MSILLSHGLAPIAAAVLFAVVTAVPPNQSITPAQPAPASPVDERKAAVTQDVVHVGDKLSIRALHVPEIGPEPVVVDDTGFARVSLIGDVKLAGLTIRQAEDLLEKDLGAYVKKPEVSLTILAGNGRFVSILGAVNKPGRYEVQGDMTVSDLISLSGGLREDAGYLVNFSRPLSAGALPLANVSVDNNAGLSRAQMPLTEVTVGNAATQNIKLQGGDTVFIPKGEAIYVLGDVKKSGSIILRERQGLSTLEALSLAEGALPSASLRQARILKRSDSGKFEVESTIDIRAVMSGKENDKLLFANEILFIPNNSAKTAWTRGLETALQLGTGVIIYRR